MNSGCCLSGRPYFLTHLLHQQAGRCNLRFGHEPHSCPWASVHQPVRAIRSAHPTPLAVSSITHSTDEKTEAREADLGLELHVGTRATKAIVTAPSTERQEAPGETAPGGSARPNRDLSEEPGFDYVWTTGHEHFLQAAASPLHVRWETEAPLADG